MGAQTESRAESSTGIQDRALRASEERHRLISRATNDALWDWNLVTNNVWWGPGLSASFGYTASELEPDVRSWTNRIHPEDVRRVLDGIHAVIDDPHQSTWTDEYRFKRADGSFAIVVDRGEVIREAAGRPVRMVGGMTDITSLREAERAARERAALLDIANDAIFVRDLDDVVTYWNRAAERIFCTPARDALGRTFASILGDSEALRDPMNCLLRDNQWTGELTQRAAGGHEVVVAARWTLVRDERGAPRAILCIATDITELKRREAEIRQAQRLESIGRLAGGIAHDFNNLLFIIISCTALVKAELDPSARGRRELDEVLAASDRASKLTKQLLAFSRQQVLEPKLLDIDEVVAGLVDMLRRLTGDDVEISCARRGAAGRVLADPGQLGQVLINLVANARDAMPRGGRVTIETATIDLAGVDAERERVPPGRYVVLSVSDTGSGMSAETQAHIFEPFFTTKADGKGTGLGLATVFGIVRQSGGHITVQSAPGAGATFRVYLPRAGDGAAPHASPAPISPRDTAGDETILLVENEPAVRSAIRATLQRRGYRVLDAENAGEALLISEQHDGPIHLLLTDIVMPRLNGRQLAARLSKDRPAMAVLLMSGYAEDARGDERALDAPLPFLPKPATPDELLRKVRDVLDAGAAGANGAHARVL